MVAYFDVLALLGVFSASLPSFTNNPVQSINLNCHGMD